MTTITRAKGGTEERQVDISTLQVPDLWHIAQWLRKEEREGQPYEASERVLKCWSLCHDLLRHIRDS